MLNAIIFVPPDPASRPWLVIDAQYCARKDYQVVAVATDWNDVLRMLKDDDIDVVVVGRREHLPPDRTPRLEIVTEPPPDDDPPETRRPRRT